MRILAANPRALLLSVLLCAAAWAGARGDGPAVIADRDAAAHVGQLVAVEGLVAEVFYSKKGDVFLDFGAPYPNEVFSGVIFAGSLAAFDDPGAYRRARVRVTGTIRLYRGRPEIVLDKPDQISVLP